MLDGISYEMKSEDALRGNKKDWRERWLALPARYFGCERDVLTKLYLNDVTKVMVVSNQTFEALAELPLKVEEIDGVSRNERM